MGIHRSLIPLCPITHVHARVLSVSFSDLPLHLAKDSWSRIGGEALPIDRPCPERGGALSEAW